MLPFGNHGACMTLFSLEKCNCRTSKMNYSDVAVEHLACVLHCQLVPKEIFKGLCQQQWILVFSEWWNGFIVYISVLPLYGRLSAYHTAAFSIPLSGRYLRRGLLWVFEISCLYFRTLAEILAIWSPAGQSTYLEITALLLAVCSLRKWLRAGSQLKPGWSSIPRVIAGPVFEGCVGVLACATICFDVKLLEQEVLNS